ncbi:MAG: dihydrolipoyl dehydrogenase [Acidobacteria bacterium]|jgi:dihydrolipoamide dehydrogenase|nr:dihydrolipoyl dehydrogenase [Acidobacteriota bacterium]
MSQTTQVVVIGAGPGGYAAAFAAADLGLQVTLVDPEANPGGVCLFRGCIPSKALLHVAKVMSEAKHAPAWGITFGEPTIDLDKLRAYKDAVVGKMTGGLGQLNKARKINYIQGMATFTSSTTLSIDLTAGGKDDLTFKNAIIATGSRPTTIPGWTVKSDRLMDSTGALELKDIPKTLLVVGGGYIGLELGSVYAALGTKVTVVEMTGGLLPGADRDLVTFLSRSLEKTLHKIMLNTKVVSVKDAKNAVTVTLDGEGLKDDEKTQTFDRVLVSIGRRPNSAVPGLDKTRVKVNDKGFIEVDPRRRTDDPNIFAIGDVVGEPMLAHKASAEARVAVETIAGHDVVFEPQAIPAVVFTDPEVAWCGLTETEAKKQNRKVEVAKFPWAALGRAVAIDRPEGVTKLIIDPDTERILGVGIVGSGAGELIAEGVVAVEMAALATDLKMSIHPHPTLSETMMEAAEVFFGQSVHVFRPKKK